jgi:hypothetical protein
MASWPLRSISFAQVCARVSGQAVAGVPKIMEMQRGQAGCPERGEPDTAAEVRAAQR